MLLTWRNHTLCWHLVIEVSFFSSYAVTKRALVKRNLLQRFLLLFSYLRKWHFWGPVSQQRMIGSAKNWYHVKLHAKSYEKGGSHFCVTCVLHDAFASRSFSFLGAYSSSSCFYVILFAMGLGTFPDKLPNRFSIWFQFLYKDIKVQR